MGLAFIWVFKGNKALPRQFNHQARGVGPELAHRPKNMAQTQCNAGRAGPYMQVNNFSKACISSSAATNFWRVWMRFHLLLLLTEKGSKMTILRRDLCCTLSPVREHVHEGNKSSAAVKTLNGQWRLQSWCCGWCGLCPFLMLSCNDSNVVIINVFVIVIVDGVLEELMVWTWDELG